MPSACPAWFEVAYDIEQSFHPPTSLRDFYRYIRVDFHSHYGSEFYCPVSLLRVFGLTHLEEWKWDSRANRYEQLQVPAQPPSQKASAEPAPPTLADAVIEVHIATKTLDPSAEPPFETGSIKPNADIPPSDPVSPIQESTSVTQDMRSEASSSPLANAEPEPVTTDPPQPSPSVVSRPASNSSQSTPVPVQQTMEVTSSLTVRSPSPPLPSQATPVISLGSQALVPPPQASASGGESIYRTIMNRIAMLELNATLHARYVEESTVGVRELLKRLTEEVGRLEGIVR